METFMDPDAAWDELLSLLNMHTRTRHENDRAIDVAGSLREWIAGGGFMPAKMLASGLAIQSGCTILRAITVAGCEDLL